MNTVTIVLQDAPYGSERVWNALRLTEALLTTGSKVRIFLYADSVVAAKKGQKTPKGFYNVGEMLEKLIKKGVEVRSCLTCTSARGLTQEDFVEGAVVGKTIDLARWVSEGGQVMVF
ncbi:MAG TPA: DsrE family protein [Thermodesulfobacteriota bacterium]|nr:DsrE family protein [Thermodesulfobacteriota bacterium]